MINYSIIIPHHNTPELLKKCVDSIPQREDIQIIIVDDNSDPAIVDFDSFPGRDRENVEVVFNKNGKGAGHARNLGLEIAKGKWLFFVDADDYIIENSWSVLDRHCESKADIIYVGCDSIYIDSNIQANRHTRIESQLLKAKEIDTLESYECLRLSHVNPIGKMIRKSIVDANNITFDEVRYSNDVMFSVKTGWAAKTIEIDTEKVYMITVTKGSLTNRKNLDNFMTRYEVYLRHNRFMRNINRSQYQRSIMSFYIKISRFGINAWWKATKLLMKHKGNPFIGITHWFSTIQTAKKNNIIMNKYKTN